MNNLLDDYALISPLRYRNNKLKLGIAIFGLLAGVSSTSVATPLFVAFCMGITTVFFGKVPLKFYFQLMLAPMGFAIAGTVVILFFFGSGSEVFSFNVFGYRLVANAQGVDMALHVISRTVSGMSCMFFLSLSTPVVELFSVLKSIRVPDVVIELSMLIYRYIFVFLEVAMSIKYAQTVRLGYKDFKTSLSSVAMLASTLFISSWEQGEKLYVSMSSRCYDGKLAMFEARRPIRLPEAIIAGVYVISTIACSYLSIT
ncbi:MAG TPA: cobalt ECF transporter T component CbiQ [Methanosarcinaceae archaeon]|nr:cobalt ECF transporter T component CbiQ [Methanosarcinaceae archaeon]